MLRVLTLSLLAGMSLGLPHAASWASAGSASSAGEAPIQNRVLTGRVLLPPAALLPKQAVLTVRVEDVSLADAPARLMAEFKRDLTGSDPKLDFKITVAQADIAPHRRYSLRATIHEAAALRFTSTQFHPVFATDGPGSATLNGQRLEIPLEAVGPVTTPLPHAPQPGSVFGSEMPSSFSGVLPCADCEGIQHRLTLRDDGSYRLRLDYLGKPGRLFTEWGRWSVQPKQGLMPGRLLLQGARQEARHFVLVPGTQKTPARLRQLDRQGRHFSSSANLDLHPVAAQDEGQEPLRLRGEFRYMADAANFTDCASGLRWPVQMGGDYLALERRYGELRSSPGAGIWVELKGRVALSPSMEGPPREHVLVDQFIAADGAASCAAPAQTLAPEARPPLAQLLNTYWKLIEIEGQPLLGTAVQALGDVSLSLSEQEARARLKSVCGNAVGAYQLNGNTLKFSAMAGTISTCPEPAKALVLKLIQALNVSQTYRIEGEQLLLMGGDQNLARFESVYLR
ncbi:copper resistance protein NlpE N-terminal domain-containing protein [Paucibacter sp. Y2R2-4]|uniref:copper resistance protein NlpE N-terminal domain-containing protein n=1 Tax=Paucibacter sp. Y2R2-4 TaxID=2893553 RepID=UPI0021E3C613|nr:copper resistance protein NlpE N-terminal domain-containing protein [Paucibacter sp. Y2R2-4]MCV2348242.1 copper resistance protein NlpE N-terminal domain-containing protein [Paucibacter sp. Y2R2-4]